MSAKNIFERFSDLPELSLCFNKHNIQNMLLEEEKQSEKSGSHFFFHFEIKMRRQ